VVDDDPAIRAVLVDILDDAGFTTTDYDQGLPALAAVNRDYFDLLLIDQWLPDLNGIQICEAARERYGNTAVVLLVTADTRRERGVSALSLGADDVITKPFDMGELLARIEVRLRGRGAAGAAG
jgi:DNA-binding response OmpR family regulator